MLQPCLLLINQQSLFCLFVYYESIKRELNKRLIFDSRCDTRLKTKDEGCKRLAYTVSRGTVIPKDIDEVNKRAVCECDG